VRTLFGQNCFHHFPDPEKFFSEAARVINPGGGIILIEPYYGPAATLVYKRLFTTEGFDKHAPRWNELSLDPNAKPNQALSFMVLKRDVKIFNEKFPAFEIVQSKPIRNYVRYVSSGGLNFRQLVPDRLISLLKATEFLLSPFADLLALHYVITLRRR
jgi:SAM-dependent methyltransferase